MSWRKAVSDPTVVVSSCKTARRGRGAAWAPSIVLRRGRVWHLAGADAFQVADLEGVGMPVEDPLHAGCGDCVCRSCSHRGRPLRQPENHGSDSGGWAVVSVGAPSARWLAVFRKDHRNVSLSSRFRLALSGATGPVEPWVVDRIEELSENWPLRAGGEPQPVRAIDVHRDIGTTDLVSGLCGGPRISIEHGHRHLCHAVLHT